MSDKQTYRASLSVLCLVFLALSCSHEDTLADALQAFSDARNEERLVSCACPETIVTADGGSYESQAECLANTSEVDEADLTCMEGVLGTLSDNVEDRVELIECLSRAISARTQCKRANLEVCSSETVVSCHDQQVGSLDACQAGYASDELEALWLCVY